MDCHKWMLQSLFVYDAEQTYQQEPGCVNGLL
jgi:hypothetical protein